MHWDDILKRSLLGADDRAELAHARSFAEIVWQEAVVAFANTNGGVVLLGIADDGTIDGVPMYAAKVQLRITDALQTATSAPIQARVGSHAVEYRDYSILGSKILVEVSDDRVSITSPGALPNHKRPESVLAGGVPRSRNEGMPNVLLDLRYMEQRGSGYPRIVREMEAFNGTRPVLENEPLERWLRVTPKRRTASDGRVVDAR